MPLMDRLGLDPRWLLRDQDKISRKATAGRPRETMVSEVIAQIPRINARESDAFDIFNLRHFVGPNPHLGVAAVVFDFATTGYLQPLPLHHYLDPMSERYPQLRGKTYFSPAHLFAHVVSEANRLEMDLHLDHWSIKPYRDYVRIAIQTLHARTTRATIFAVWDWFEAITQENPPQFDTALAQIQQLFRDSVYGGPTMYALIRAAYEKGIPTAFLWDESLLQYGYGRHHVRGVSTTFDRDSNLDSAFTTRKDDCKRFLHSFGFPVPQGEVVGSFEAALGTVAELGYPVVIKPVVGHKGIGVTTNISREQDLEFAWEKAVESIPEQQPIRVIVEQYFRGTDFRLLCVDGKFVAATERRPASVVGDGWSRVMELVERENDTLERLDTPTSPLGKIVIDEQMDRCLQEQGISRDTVLEKGRRVLLRRVANLSAGGISLDATRTIHPENMILAQDIAQHFQLTCLGIDVIAPDLSTSWREGRLGIIEINAAPGIFMHLKPAVGESVDVPSAILNTFFPVAKQSRIPILSFNTISLADLQEIIDQVLYRRPDWTIGAVCREGLLINRAMKILHQNYNRNLQNLLRNPKLDLLIAEYPESILEADGMYYEGSDMVVLEDPSEVEMLLARVILDDSTVIIKNGPEISIQSRGLMEQYDLGPEEPFKRVYLKEIAKIL